MAGTDTSGEFTGESTSDCQVTATQDIPTARVTMGFSGYIVVQETSDASSELAFTI